MKTFTVKIWQTYYDTIDIQADTEDEARRIVGEMWEAGEVDPEYCEDSGIDIIAMNKA